MSKGSPRVTIRLPQVLLDAVEAAIARYNAKQTCRQPLDMTSFLRAAAEEKLAKMARSRNGKKKPKKPEA